VHYLQVEISVRNAGASVVNINQYGTALVVSGISSDQPDSPGQVTWEDVVVNEILKDHVWIEPGEVVVEDRLLQVGVAAPTVLQLRARIVCKRRRKKNIEVNSRRVVAPRSMS